MKFGIVQAALFIFMIIGCNSPERDLKKFNMYFDIKGVIDYQVRKFANKNLRIEKTASVNGVESKTEVSKIDWRKELKIFEAIDINKPNFKGVFRSLSYPIDSGLVNFYFKPENQKSDIQHIRVVFTKSNKLVSLEGLDLVENPVFKARRDYFMTFDTTDMTLQSYKLAGSQGFLFFEKDTFNIRSIVLK